MGSEESIKDEYGFIRYSTSSTNPSREESPTYSSPVYGRSSAPDHRRFAIALSELPALNFYNPLLNNPSSSEYIASVRSSIRSINEIGSAQFNPHPRLVRNSVPSATLTSVPPYWSQDSVKSIQSSNESDSEKKPISFSSNFNCAFINKSFLGFCVSVWIVLFLGVAAAALLYFTTKGGLLFHPFNPPTANIVYGEFHIVNRINSSEIPGENGTITNLAIQLQEKMDNMFQSSALLSTLYNRSVLFGIVAGSTHSERPSPVIYIQFKIHLNHADVMIAEKMAHVLASNLQPKEDHLDLFENWAINISAIKFAEIIPSRLKDSQYKRLASWGMWTEWTPECHLTSCNLSRTQSRNRRCLLRDRNPEEIVEESSTNRPVNFVTSCIAGSTVSAADVEIRPCNCVARSRFPRPRIPFTVVRPTKASHFRFSNTSIAAFEETCSQCRRGEVCVARLEEVVPVCRWAPDAEDPTGCGGFCRANTEYCVPLGSNSFKCDGTSECLTDSEWRCRDGFCIHNLKRCDGDFNCYDQSDELDCVKETKN